MDRELVSVIMPIYKSDTELFEQSLRSILSQTHDNLEVLIIMDPGIPVVDRAVLDKMEEFHDDHRIVMIVNRKRLGFTHSLNAAIRLAKGSYIARMDSDDVSSTQRFEEELSYLGRGNFGIVGSWAYVADSHGRVVGSLTMPVEWHSIRKRLLLHNPFIHSSILFRADLVKRAGPYNSAYEPSEDYEFYLRAFSKGFRGGNVPRFLHTVRFAPDSILRGPMWKRNRRAYIRCKIAGVTSYHFSRPYDLLFLGLSPIALLVTPKMSAVPKRAIGFYRRYAPHA